MDLLGNDVITELSGTGASGYSTAALISNNHSTNEVALFLERGSTHALETAIGKQLQKNI